jgi:Flp pilus assembly protein TadG
MVPTHTRKEKGQSLVELSFVFTLLLLLVGGIIDLGSIYYSSIALRDTTQEGAIYGASHPDDIAGIKQRITKSASFPINAAQIADITVTCDGADCVATNANSCQGHKISIEVSYNYNLIMPLIPIIIGHQTVPLTATVTATILDSRNTIDSLALANQTCN